MADVDDRWFATDKATGEKIPTARHGVGRRWVARWRDENGRQCSKSYERKSDAERFVAGVATALARGDYVDPSAGKITLRAYGDQWLQSQTFSGSTAESVETRLRLHVYPQLGGRELRSLRPSTIKAWLAGLGQQLGPNTVRTTFSWLSAILSAAVEDQVIARTPASPQPRSHPHSQAARSCRGRLRPSRRSAPPCHPSYARSSISAPAVGCERAKSGAWPSKTSTGSAAWCTCAGN
jgi:hypothetical protein